MQTAHTYFTCTRVRLKIYTHSTCTHLQTIIMQVIILAVHTRTHTTIRMYMHEHFLCYRLTEVIPCMLVRPGREGEPPVEPGRALLGVVC